MGHAAWAVVPRQVAISVPEQLSMDMKPRSGLKRISPDLSPKPRTQIPWDSTPNAHP